MRVGLGYDAHRLVADRPLILGGVDIPHTQGLLGHSDADVLSHAIGDALLGAVGAGDLGTHFPDKDPAYQKHLQPHPAGTDHGSGAGPGFSAGECRRHPRGPRTPPGAPYPGDAGEPGAHPGTDTRTRSISRPPPRNTWASPAGAKAWPPMPWCWWPSPEPI